MSKNIKKIVAGILALAAVGTGGYAVYHAFSDSEAPEESTVKTRTFTVEKGDLTVGLSESGTVSLGREYVSFPADAEVAEVLVKVGTTVEEGDNIVRFDTDDISDACADYEKKIEEAKLAYSQAEVDAKSKLAEAEQTYNESIASASIADSSYSFTMTQSASDITSAENKLASDNKQLEKYKKLAESYPDDYAVLCEYEDTLSEYETVYKGYEKQYSEYESEYKTLSKKYSEYEKKYKTYENELSDLKDEYNTYLDGVADDQSLIKNADSELEQAEQAVEKAEEAYNNALDDMNANSDKLDEYYKSLNTARSKYYSLLSEYAKKYDAMNGTITQTINSYESKIKKQEQKMKEYSDKMDEYKTDTLDTYSEKMSDYKEDVMDPYSEMISDYREEYNDYKTDFQDKYGNLDAEDIDEKIESLESSVESDSLSIEKANNSYSETSISAEQKRESTKSKAALAKEVYDNTAAQINADVESKKEAYDDIAEEYETFLEEIDAGGYVFAPCSGIISSVNASEGDSYMADQSIAVIMDSSSAYISLSVSENDISSLSVGQECEITLSAFENRSFSGEIDTISAEPARSSGSVSYTVTVKLEAEGDTEIREGMTADVTFLEKQVKDVIYVNVQAVTYHDGSNWVKIYSSDGSTVEKAVKTGFSDGRYVEITDGLSVGDKVAAESAVTMK